MADLGNRRGLWVFLFLIFGLAAVFSAIAFPMNPPAALPWVVLTGTVTVVSGYRIWRIDHPHESAQRNVARGLYLLLSSAVAVIVLAVIDAAPILLVVVLVSWLLLLALLLVALWISDRDATST